jgi:hypothetical protein
MCPTSALPAELRRPDASYPPAATPVVVRNTRSLWGDEFCSRYVGADAPGVAREQRPSGHRGVRADQEVGEDGLAWR